MGRSRYRIFENEFPYFVTCTVVGWLPVFMRPEAVEIVLDSIRYLQREKKLMVFGYVIMENHLHLIARSEDLSQHLQQFKSFTARSILDLLARRQADQLLNEFRFRKKSHKTQSTFQFWEEGNHPQQINTDEMMWQKLEYVHNNPLKRGYIDHPSRSARNYEKQPGLIEVVTDWM